MRYRCILLLLLFVFLGQSLVGCKTFDLTKTDTETSESDKPWWKKEDLPPVEQPAKIVAIWANAVFNEPGKGPMRGLGGRVYFYNAKHKPVRVDGELTAYLYDDTGEIDRETQKADKGIKFTAEEVAEKYTPTEFGPSYSFWLPWDAVGGELAQLSVIPVFKSKSGEMLVGDQARYLLPGKKPAAIANKTKPSDGEVRPASFEDDSLTADALRLKSSTIRVPPSMQKRLRRPRLARDQDGSTIRRRTLRSTQTSPSVSVPQEAVQGGSSGHGSSSVQDMGREDRNVTGIYGRRPGVVVDEVSQPVVDGQSTNASIPPPTTDSQRDLLQAQTSRSSQQVFARDRNLLDRAKSLFDRSR